MTVSEIVLVLLVVLWTTHCTVVSSATIPVHFQRRQHPGNSPVERGNRWITLPLEGNTFMYWINVAVGSPAVEFSVTVDTGSADFLIPSINCQSCRGGNHRYNASASLTSKPVYCGDSRFHCTACVNGTYCGYTMSYGDGGLSEKATIVQDIVTVGDISLPVYFGSVYEIKFGDTTPAAAPEHQMHPTSMRASYPDGMLGMAFATLNTAGTLPLFDSLVSAGYVDDIFSMCMRQDGGGVLVLGGIGPYYSEQPRYTPIPNPRFYSVFMADFLVGNVSLGFSPQVYNTKNCIVDSETLPLSVPVAVFSRLGTELQNQVCKGSPFPSCSAVITDLFSEKCVPLTPSMINAFPVLRFPLGKESDVVLTFEPQDYLRNQYFCDDTSSVGLSIAPDPSGFGTVLGAQLLQQYLVIYDREQKRIGFAATRASLCH